MFDERMPAEPPSPSSPAPPPRVPELPADLLDVHALDMEALVAAAAAAERLIAQAHGLQSEVAAELIRRFTAAAEVEKQAGITPPPGMVQPWQEAAAELAPACRWSRNMAEHRVHLADQLDARLPATLAKLRAGDIDLNRVRAVADATYTLDPETAAAVEERVLPRAAEQTPAQLRAALRRAVLAADPAAAQRRHDDAVAERRVDVRELPDGMAELTAPLRADKAEAVYARLTEIARQALEAYRAANGQLPDDTPTGAAEPSMNSLRADALLWLILGDPMPGITATGVARADSTVPAPRRPPADSAGHTNPGEQASPGGAAANQQRAGHTTAPHPCTAAPTGRPGELGSGCAHCGCARPRPQLNLHMPLGTALGLSAEPAELSGYGPIPADLARELAADATWRRIFTDPVSGAVVAAESASYQPPESMAALVRARDRTCRFPGCRQPATRADIDHRIPWPHGPTCPCNLCCLCRFHHRLKTHHGWR